MAPAESCPPPPHLPNPKTNPNPCQGQFSSGEIVRIPVFIHKITQLNENEDENEKCIPQIR